MSLVYNRSETSFHWVIDVVKLCSHLLLISLGSRKGYIMIMKEDVVSLSQFALHFHTN